MVCAVFGFGVTEMVLVAFVAILLFPPRELPKIAREIARLYGYARRTADQFRSAILEDEELNKPIREIKNIYHETRYELRRAEELAQREMAKVRMEARMAARNQRKPASTDAASTSQTALETSASAEASDSDAGASGSSSSTSSTADSAAVPKGNADASATAAVREPLEHTTAGDADAPPPHRSPSTAARVAAPPPTLRKPTASVPRGTVTPHGAATGGGSGARGTGEPSPTAPSRTGADAPRADAPRSSATNPDDADDSAAGAA
jgi:Sec-independent protein translocase protein TatA